VTIAIRRGNIWIFGVGQAVKYHIISSCIISVVDFYSQPNPLKDYAMLVSRAAWVSLSGSRQILIVSGRGER
jgi:hypothetical protein